MGVDGYHIIVIYIQQRALHVPLKLLKSDAKSIKNDLLAIIWKNPDSPLYI